MPTMNIEIIDDEGYEATIAIPAIYEICNRCQGSGTIVNPAVDGAGISSDELNADPDFAEAYFSGVYDITCPFCDGRRVIGRPDPKTEEEKTAVAKWEKANRENAEIDHIMLMELRSERGFCC